MRNPNRPAYRIVKDHGYTRKVPTWNPLTYDEACKLLTSGHYVMAQYPEVRLAFGSRYVVMLSDKHLPPPKNVKGPADAFYDLRRDTFEHLRDRFFKADQYPVCCTYIQNIGVYEYDFFA